MVISSTTDDTQIKDPFIPSHLAIDPALGGQGEAFLNGCCHLDGWCTLRKKSELQTPGNTCCFFELGSVDLSTVRNALPITTSTGSLWRFGITALPAAVQLRNGCYWKAWKPLRQLCADLSWTPVHLPRCAGRCAGPCSPAWVNGKHLLHFL